MSDVSSGSVIEITLAGIGPAGVDGDVATEEHIDNNSDAHNAGSISALGFDLDTSNVQTELDIINISLTGKQVAIPPGTYAEYVALAADPALLIFGEVVRDVDGAVMAAGVIWPDGTLGAFSATAVSASLPGAVDSYTITYGAPVVRTYTQPAVTRDADGAVIDRPTLVVS